MHLYLCTLKDIEFCSGKEIADILKKNAEDAGLEIDDKERESWKHSIPFLRNVLKGAGIKNCGLVFEYKLNFSSYRIDCIVTGYNSNGDPTVVVVELKQWDNMEETENWNFLRITKGNWEDERLHPCIQAASYQHLLENYHSGVNDHHIRVLSCAYLHNFTEDTNEFQVDLKYFGKMKNIPVLYGQRDIEKFQTFLQENIGYGNGKMIADQIAKGTFKINNNVIDEVSDLIQMQKKFVLIGKQNDAFHTIMNGYNEAKEQSNKKKYVFIIKGEPGTGKTVIAMRLLAKILKQERGTGKILFTTPAKAFRAILNHMVDQNNFFRLVYKVAEAGIGGTEDIQDLVIVDEAHRIPKKSKNFRTDKEYCVIEGLVKASNVMVFFLDEKQRIMPKENGTVAFIRKRMQELSGDFDICIKEFDLQEQFRCNGSKQYLDMIEDLLDMGTEKEDREEIKKSIQFDFQIIDAPQEMEEKLRDKMLHGENTSRMVAGFCWDWYEKWVRKDEIVISSENGEIWKKRWNLKGKGGKAQDEEYIKWATNDEGFEQVGCVYSSQGFQYDYIGVIFGKDLIYRNGWQVNLAASKDPNWKRAAYLTEEEKITFFKNIYRILLTRGSKGCYIYFDDLETRKYIESKFRKYQLNK